MELSPTYYSMCQLSKGAGGRTRTMPIRLRYLFLVAIVCGGSFLILSISNNSTTVLFLSSEAPATSFQSHITSTSAVVSDETFTIKTEGCTIPGLKPFDESIKKFVTRPSPNLCPNANVSLLEYNSTHIWVQTDNLIHYGVSKDINISCCYKSFYRPVGIADITSRTVDNRVQYEPCIQFSSYIEVMNEFVRVSCDFESRTLYEQFFLFAPKKPLSPILPSLIDDSYNISENRFSYNVIVMGLDSISRLNLYRTMPKTLAFLKKKGAIELLGYNKVGDNTFPNITPLLLGIKHTELKRTCYPNFRASFDNCPFIWEWYKQARYYTALGEDTSKLGTFNLGRIGFVGTPTDYYIHTFIHEAEMHVGNKQDYNTFVCMGDKHFYKVLLDYIVALTNTLKSSKLFGFFWEVTLSHDYLNYPMLMDENYESFLQKLDDSRYLDDTILILLSDHGIRWGDIRYTKQGRLEERLPFVHIMLPTSFKKNYSLAYNNLKLNSRRLSTPFDIHATLLDLINLDSITNDQLKLRTEMAYAYKKSISLFIPLPENRTCKTAGIDNHWCTCHKSKKISIYSPVAIEVSTHLLKNLNHMLRNYPQCSRLSLAEVIEATERYANSSQNNEDDWKEVMVVARASPGGGVFEGTLRHENQKWTTVGAVSRINLYGNQSYCIGNYALKLYCYC